MAKASKLPAVMKLKNENSKMRNKLKYLMLAILLAVAYGAAGQSYEIDRVCRGAERHYRIDGEAGSVYTWQLTDPLSVVTTLPETADTVTIIWNVPAGTYILTTIQIGINGCDSLQLGSIEVLELPEALAGENMVLCESAPVTLDLATAAYYSSLLWTTTGDGIFDDASIIHPVYTPGPADIAAGSVTLTLTASGLGNDDSCVPAVSSLILTISSLVADNTMTPASCNGTADGEVTLLATGGTEPYLYTLDGTSNSTGIFTGLMAGTYTWIITDASNCELTGDITVTAPDVIAATLNQFNVNCFGASNGSIELINVSGGSGNYEYRINGGLWQTEASFSGLAAGDYLVEVRDALAPDCIVILGTITITEPAILAANTTHTDETYPGANDGTITVSDATGGSGSYQYSVDGVNWFNSPLFTGLNPADYTVYVRDANATDCYLDIEIITILPANALTADVSWDNISCFNADDGRIVISNPQNGGGNYEYSIDGGTTWHPGGFFNNLQPGDYAVMLRDADVTANQILLENVTLTQPEELVASITGTNPTTPGGTDGTATATVSGGTPAYSYLWDDALAQTTATATGLTAGTYTVIVTDANGCTASESITLTDPLPELAVTIINVQHVSCFGGSDGEATAFVTGGMPPYTYLWNDAFAQTSATATGLTPGNYTVIVTDALGATASASVTITQPEQLTVNVIGDNPSAPGGSDGQATATPAGGTPGYTYLWNNGATTQTINGLTSGLYTVTVTDANGCVAEGSVILTEPASQLTVTATVTKQISCFGAADGQLLASAQGGIAPYQYSWNDPATQSGTTAINLAAGSYTVTVTDAVGFTAQATVLLTQPEPLQLIAQALPSICSDDNGSITASATGGTGLYEYSLSGVTGWQTEQLFTGLPAGIYTVLARDENGCTAESQIVEINYLAGPDIIETELTHTTFWLPNGSVVIVASGYATPLQYSITGNTWQSDRVFNDLMAGHYMAYVQDANGCVDSLDFEILNQVDGNVLVSADTVSFCMNVPVTIPVGSRNFTDISSFTLELEFDPAMLAFMDLFMKNPVLDTPNGEFRYQLNGNTLIISFSAYTGSITIPENENLFSIGFEALMPGLANISWNSIQCNIFASGGYQVQEVMVPGQAIIKPAPALYVSGAGEFCEGDTLTLRAASFGGEELSYLWTGPTGHTHLSAEWQLGALGSNDHGHYTVRATNTDECSDEESLDLIVNAKPIIYLGYADTVCYGQPQLLDPGNGFESYLWQDGSTAQTMLAMDPGLYSVVVTNEKGCMAADSVALVPCTIDLLLPNAFTPNSDGLNDVFRPIFRGWEPGSYFMQIYSRWGQLLYETTNPSEGWDGTADGVPLPPGVYAYVIAFEAPSYVTRLVSSPVSGSVTLIR